MLACAYYTTQVEFDPAKREETLNQIKRSIVRVLHPEDPVLVGDFHVYNLIRDQLNSTSTNAAKPGWFDKPSEPCRPVSTIEEAMRNKMQSLSKILLACGRISEGATLHAPKETSQKRPRVDPIPVSYTHLTLPTN